MKPPRQNGFGFANQTNGGSKSYHGNPSQEGTQQANENGYPAQQWVQNQDPFQGNQYQAQGVGPAVNYVQQFPQQNQSQNISQVQGLGNDSQQVRPAAVGPQVDRNKNY